MTITTKTFLICSRDAADVLGLYEAASEAAAHDVLARDMGYRDCAHEAEVLSKSVEYLRADLTITEVDLAATVKEIAEAMVAADRESGDVEPEVLDDPAAADASHWDLSVFGVAVEDVGVDDALATAIARGYMHLVRDAYARAWRAAVELDLAARDDDDAVGWERDPDTRGGEVSSRAIPRAQAREMVAALVAAGWAASDAPDHDDPALSWVYRVRDDAA